MQLEQIKNSIFVTNIIKMKRVVSLLVFALLLNGCDDGDLIQEDISFEDVATQNCTTNNIIYKLKDTEALILEVVGFTFPTETKSQELDISASNRVLYRFYNGTVTSSTICETIPPATPIVVDQWTTSGGKIVINTTAVKTTNTTDNSTKITGYNHNITFKNITFVKSNGTQVYETFPFGDYVISATPLPFAFNKTLEQCSSSKQLYDYNSSEALILDIDPALIVNEATPLNTPRTGLISDTKNKLTYRLFSGLLTGAYFCNTTFPATPAVSEEWIAVAGVANESGIVEVTTTTLGTGFKHTVVLKKAKMKKGSSDFILGDNYIYGELLTTN
jgi:PBP1b-binding outer membrane lipoprotein LpoB